MGGNCLRACENQPRSRCPPWAHCPFHLRATERRRCALDHIHHHASDFVLWRTRRSFFRSHMTEDSGVRVSSDEPVSFPNIDSSSQTKPRYFSSLHIRSYLIPLLVRFISLEKMSEILVVLFWRISSCVLLCCHKIYRFTCPKFALT